MLSMKAIVPVGKCDICHTEGRYLEEMNDKHSDQVKSQCLYGCKDYRSIPVDVVEAVKILAIEEVETSFGQDTKWKVIVSVGEDVSEIYITRNSNET